MVRHVYLTDSTEDRRWNRNPVALDKLMMGGGGVTPLAVNHLMSKDAARSQFATFHSFLYRPADTADLLGQTLSHVSVSISAR